MLINIHKFLSDTPKKIAKNKFKVIALVIAVFEAEVAVVKVLIIAIKN